MLLIFHIPSEGFKPSEGSKPGNYEKTLSKKAIFIPKAFTDRNICATIIKNLRKVLALPKVLSIAIKI